MVIPGAASAATPALASPRQPTRRPAPARAVLFTVLDTWRFTIIVSNVRAVFARWEWMYQTHPGHDHSKSGGADVGEDNA